MLEFGCRTQIYRLFFGESENFGKLTVNFQINIETGSIQAVDSKAVGRAICFPLTAPIEDDDRLTIAPTNESSEPEIEPR